MEYIQWHMFAHYRLRILTCLLHLRRDLTTLVCKIAHCVGVAELTFLKAGLNVKYWHRPEVHADVGNRSKQPALQVKNSIARVVKHMSGDNWKEQYWPTFITIISTHFPFTSHQFCCHNASTLLTLLQAVLQFATQEHMKVAQRPPLSFGHLW